MNDDRTLLPEQITSSALREAAYDQIDRYLRNNLDDEDYADYSQALDLIYTSAALSAAPAQEPVAYIDPMKFAALRRFTDRGGVLTTITPHRAFPDDVALYASPLPQEPQEGKALTDERILYFARHAADRIPASNYEGRVLHAVRMALSASFNQRGAQEGKAGEDEAEFTIESQDGVYLAAATGPRAEAWAEIQHYAAQYAEQMPTERDAIRAMFSAWLRLKELGWREGQYMPSTGERYAGIQCGSTGIHAYTAEPFDRMFTVYDGDIWPTRQPPVLFRPWQDTDVQPNLRPAYPMPEGEQR